MENWVLTVWHHSLSCFKPSNAFPFHLKCQFCHFMKVLHDLMPALHFGLITVCSLLLPVSRALTLLFIPKISHAASLWGLRRAFGICSPTACTGSCPCSSVAGCFTCFRSQHKSHLLKGEITKDPILKIEPPGFTSLSDITLLFPLSGHYQTISPLSPLFCSLTYWLSSTSMRMQTSYEGNVSLVSVQYPSIPTVFNCVWYNTWYKPSKIWVWINVWIILYLEQCLPVEDGSY